MADLARPRLRFPWLGILGLILAWGVAGYAIATYLTGNPLGAGLVWAKMNLDHFRASEAWTIALVIHAGFGAAALAVGAVQALLVRRRKWLGPRGWRRLHLSMGLTYTVAVLFAGAAGAFLAPSAMGGWVASLGFASLDVMWITTTILAAVKGNLARTAQDSEAAQRAKAAHRKWMIRSYALTAAAITLRLWLPIFALSGVSFVAGYIVISWISWVPNLFAAQLLIRRRPAG